MRVFWRHVAAAALEVGLDPGTLAALAETVFFFVDQLSSASAHGFVLEQEEAGALRERHREELVDLMLSEPSDPAAVRAAARRADWPVPEKVSVVLVEPDDASGRRALSRLDARALPIRRPPLVGAVVPRVPRPAERAALTGLLRGAHATVGAAVPPEQLGRSLHFAEIAARLTKEHLLSDDPVFVADHLDAIIVHRDHRLLDALGDQVLAPLEACPARVTRTPARDPPLLAAPHGGSQGDGRGAARPPADRALPDGAAARAVRGVPRRPGGPGAPDARARLGGSPLLSR